MNSNKFITTEILSNQGKRGEKLVWEAIKAAFNNRNCLGYWRYPIFFPSGKFRKEPDILILDYHLGIIIIEVKSIHIEQIVDIQGHRWEYKNFYTKFGNPYQQAENQLFSLLEFIAREPTLKDKIMGKVMIALPYITQEQWQAKGFDLLPSNPPIIFQDFLDNPVLLAEFIKKVAPVKQGKKSNNISWQLLLSIIAGTPVFVEPKKRVLSNKISKGVILNQVRSQLSQCDLQQEKIAKQIAPGLQRIRGIAGSGKTVLLCQKAALMHLKYPHWKIALVFFSRSLYQPITNQVNKWLKYFSNNQIEYNQNNKNLLILHAWGNYKQPGLYSTICQATGVKYLTVNHAVSKEPSEALAEVCVRLLESKIIPQVFDAILIDEAQDLISEQWKYQDKQPFFWLAYQALKSTNNLHLQQKRLIWCYDELQSLDSAKIPTASELFGEKLGNLVTGKHEEGINKTEILNHCYRTPHYIISAAHAMVLGLLRKNGILTGVSNRKDWEALGYEVIGDCDYGQEITIKRSQETVFNPIDKICQDNVIDFNIYKYRQQELTELANNIKNNLRSDGLRPSQEILIIILGNYLEAIKLETHVASFLIRQGIDIYIPTSKGCNIIKSEEENYEPNKFWCEGAVTISRIHRVKGQEADQVYLIGLDNIAKEESNIYLRNQLFIALTRVRAWVTVSGIEDYPMYEEFKQVIASKDSFTFMLKPPLKRTIGITEKEELLIRLAKGGKNFQNADLKEVDLTGVNLKNANLIGANLQGANLTNAQLDGVKLISADLIGANLSGASLKKAKLMGANISHANLRGVDLTGASLDNADLTGADLTDAKLD